MNCYVTVENVISGAHFTVASDDRDGMERVNMCLGYGWQVQRIYRSLTPPTR